MIAIVVLTTALSTPTPAHANNRSVGIRPDFSFVRCASSSERALTTADWRNSNLLTPLETRFGELLPTSGFQNLAALKSILANSSGPARTLYELIEGEHFDVVIQRPESGRDAIAGRGFMNFHQTGTSVGDKFAERDEAPETAMQRRAIVEASYLGQNTAEYERLPGTVKPKYGYVRLPVDAPNAKDPGTSDILKFGEDSWVLKKSRIRTRTTFALGDSLDRVSANVPGAYLGNGRFKPFRPDHWQQSLIPWTHRTLLVPESVLRYQSEGLLRVPYTASPQKLASFFENNGLSALLPYQRGSQHSDIFNGASYVEAQVYDAVTLDDVEAFEFRKSPPTGAFLQTLLSRGIEIRDARQWPPRPWQKDQS